MLRLSQIRLLASKKLLGVFSAATFSAFFGGFSAFFGSFFSGVSSVVAAFFFSRATGEESDRTKSEKQCK